MLSKVLTSRREPDTKKKLSLISVMYRDTITTKVDNIRAIHDVSSYEPDGMGSLQHFDPILSFCSLVYATPRKSERTKEQSHDKYIYVRLIITSDATES